MLPTLRRTVGSWEPNRWIDREFDRLLHGFGLDIEHRPTGAYPVDIWEDDDNVYVDAEMPGFKNDEIDVTLEHGTLNIAAERKSDDEKGLKHLTERRYTRVHRSFSVPTTVDDTKVAAKLDNGVLHLTLPKVPEVKPRKIKVG